MKSSVDVSYINRIQFDSVHVSINGASYGWCAVSPGMVFSTVPNAGHNLAAIQRRELASEFNVRLVGVGIPANRVVCPLAAVAVICAVFGL